MRLNMYVRCVGTVLFPKLANKDLRPITLIFKQKNFHPSHESDCARIWCPVYSGQCCCSRFKLACCVYDNHNNDC